MVAALVRGMSSRPCRSIIAELRGRASLEGFCALTDVELIVVMLGTSRQTARRVLDKAGGLGGLPQLGPYNIAEVHAVGRARAFRLAACVEVGRRLALVAARGRRRVATGRDVAHLMAPRIGHLTQEHMWVVSVDGRSRVRGIRCVAQGGRHGLSISAREILTAALADAASAFVLVHNHPSGSPEPSPEDLHMTRAVAEAAHVVGVPLLDHVIVTSGGAFSSLLESGQLAAVDVDRIVSRVVVDRVVGDPVSRGPPAEPSVISASAPRGREGQPPPSG